MVKGGGGGDVEPATSAAGGMCDRFLTFLAKNLSVSRMKSIAEGPRSGAGTGGGHLPPTEGGDDGGVEEDEFAIPIERAEFDFQLSGHGDGGHSSVVAATILEESAATMTTRDVPDEKDGAAAAAAAAADGMAAPAVAAVEETKVRRTVTIKEDRPAQEAGGSGAASAATATVERKKSLFRKRQASSVAGGEEQGGARVPKRSGLRPRMPQVPRVPSNINERSSTFIEERKKSFGGKPAPEK
ncbi:unnamed protein product [Miscanthus lutarioriparius]|uniref:Uncharacterized protein n=1 Tax=Miscanthus lutarioriparius TaxID=422564 RepID=A0A811Q6V1_9POAL|nr:unnamed protein product [Miscanthus lutarioriparius]